jgi:TolB-like protein
MKLFIELKRRNVFRAGAAYVLLGWVVVQVTETVSPALNLPDWTLSFVMWIGIIGFPFALFFAWAYELTPDGIKRETDVDRAESITSDARQKLDVALVALLIIAIGFIAWDRLTGAPDEAVPGVDVALTAPPEDGVELSSNSIAVLPLINMSAATDNAFFAGGVHEEILTNLSRIEGLRVVSRTTALRYLDSDMRLSDIGRELDVRYIVEGSVRRIGEHVRITVQLIDALRDAHLWANNYDRELVDVFATQSEVAKEITNSLHLEIQPETVGILEDMPTQSVRAYDLYLKAKSIERSEYQSESTLRRQRKLLQEAVLEDPDFVEAWGYLNEILDTAARTIVQFDWFGETETERKSSFEEIRVAAQRALDRAVALDPDNVETLLAQASDFVTEQESVKYRTERRKFIDRAIELEPDNAFAWYVLAWWYRIEGDGGAATSSFLKALELDPFHASIVSGSLQHFRLSGDEEMTARLFERLAEIAPEKGDEQSLGTISPRVKLDNLIFQFGETADKTFIERYAAVFEESVGKFEFETAEILTRLSLMMLRNDFDGILDTDTGEMPETSNPVEKLLYFIANNVILSAQLIAGQSDEARATAQRMLDDRAKVETLIKGRDSRFLDNFMIVAYATLDDDEGIQRFLQSHFDERGNPLNDYQLPAYIALARVDADRAVELALAQKARHPQWFGTDMIATWHVHSRHMLVHPDMQRFYVNEGKWVDYLAERVPEYAQYRQ